MKKISLVTSFLGAILIVVLYQNCGKGFQTNALDEASISSAMDPETLPETPADTPPVPSPLPVDLPPPVTTNPPSGPEITVGLSNKLLLSRVEGIDAEITVKDPTGLSYDWTLNGVHFKTTVPKLNTKWMGNVNVSVVVTDSQRRSSTSSATYLISRFAVIDGKLKYLKSTQYEEVTPQADISTLKLLSVETVADAMHIYQFQSVLSVATIPQANTAKMLSPNYYSVNGAVYFKNAIIPQAAPETFSVINEAGYSKDGNRVFCKNSELLGADLATFEIAVPGIANFARDKSSLYSSCSPLRAYDPNSFSVVTSPHIDPKKDVRALVNLSGKLFYVGGSAIMGPMEFLEVPLAPTAGAPWKIVGEFSFETASKKRIVTDGTHYALFVADYSTKASRFDILNVPFQVDVASFVYRYGVFFMDKTNVYVLQADNKSMQILPNAVPTNFTSVGSYHYKSGNILYRVDVNGKWEVVTGVDAASFTSVAGDFYFYKDQSQVYYMSGDGNLQVVAGASPASFVKIGDKLYKDASKVWYGDYNVFQLLNGIDGATLELVGASSAGILIKDKGKLYAIAYDYQTKTVLYPTIEVSNVSEIKLVPGSAYYIYNSTTLYYLSGITARVVAGVQPVGLKYFQGGCIGANATLVCSDRVVPGIDASQLVQVGSTRSQFYKDTSSVYVLPRKLVDAQAATFKLVDASKSDFYATDGVRIWGNSTLIPQADLATFKVLTILTAEDKAYYYQMTTARPK